MDFVDFCFVSMFYNAPGNAPWEGLCRAFAPISWIRRFRNPRARFFLGGSFFNLCIAKASVFCETLVLWHYCVTVRFPSHLFSKLMWPPKLIQIQFRDVCVRRCFNFACDRASWVFRWVGFPNSCTPNAFFALGSN